MNKRQTMILVCEADDFGKISENVGIPKMSFFLKKIIKSCCKQKFKCLVFLKLSRRVCNHL